MADGAFPEDFRVAIAVAAGGATSEPAVGNVFGTGPANGAGPRMALGPGEIAGPPAPADIALPIAVESHAAIGAIAPAAAPDAGATNFAGLARAGAPAAFSPSHDPSRVTILDLSPLGPLPAALDGFAGYSDDFDRLPGKSVAPSAAEQPRLADGGDDTPEDAPPLPDPADVSLGAQRPAPAAAFAAGLAATTQDMKNGPLAALDAQLAALYYAHSPQAAAMAPFISSVSQFAGSNHADADGNLFVTIDATAKDGNGASLLQQLSAIGLQGGASFGAVASGRLSADRIGALLEVADLGHARESGFLLNAGVVDNQADQSLSTDAARSEHLGIWGDGITVGVLSDSFDTSGVGSMATDVTNDDLPGPSTIYYGSVPPSTTVLADSPGGEDEGRAMAQIIHDEAPNANIIFATAEGGQAAFAQHILDLAAAGAKVIVDDITYFAEPDYQDGVIGQAIKQVESQGVVYLSSAGNDGQKGFEAAWQDSGAIGPFGEHFAALNTDATPQFLTITIPAGVQAIVAAQWDQPAFSADGFAHSASDEDLFLYDAAGTTLLAANTESNDTATSDPVTLLAYANTSGSNLTANIALGHFSGPTPGDIKIIVLTNERNATVEPSPLNYNNGTIYGHHAATGSLAIAADDYHNVYQNNIFPQVESFSSGGPTRFLFDDAGNRLAAPDDRIGPAVTGIDGGNTSFFGGDSDGDGFPNFFGTSAAAPSIAAVVAMLVQADPTLTNQDVENLLRDSAADVFLSPGTSHGPDNLTGSGVVNAAVALNEAMSHTITVQPGQVQFLGTHGNDTFAFDNLVFGEAPGSIVRGRLVAADQIDGGAGSNTVSLNGDYTGSNAVVFTPTTMVNVGRIELGAGFDYDLTTADNTVAAGKTLVVDGAALGAADGLALNGGAEIDGRFVFDGGAGADALTGGGRNDRLDGRAGGDSLAGGGGDDTYIVDAGDTVVEGAGQGTDTVKTALASYTLAANLENLVFTGSGDFFGTGNDLDNSIAGGSGNDSLDGGAGADMLTGGAGSDRYIADDTGDTAVEGAGQGIDTVETTLASYTLGANVENLTHTGGGDFAGTGNALDNAIDGGNGDDALDGGGGADFLIGHAGNDTYTIDNAGDVVVEGAGEGIDTVETALASYTLGGNVENLTHTGGGDFAGTGNGLDNAITGDSGDDLLSGLAGNDTLIGRAGNDTLIVDGPGDVVVEDPGQGIDTVETALASYTLGANVENLTFIGAGNFAGTGNSLANTITGGSGNDTLNGAGGADILKGLAGNDSYIVDNSGDAVTEAAGQGTDTARTALASYTLGANLENLTYTGGGNFAGTGNALANMITGGIGNDTLNGLAGNDTLKGSVGHDAFLFSTALNAATNLDRISAFSTTDDTIRLSQSIFGAAGGPGTLAAAAFFIGNAAHDASDRIIYASTSGALSYDPDGTGAASATRFATLSTGLPLANTDFLIV